MSCYLISMKITLCPLCLSGKFFIPQRHKGHKNVNKSGDLKYLPDFVIATPKIELSALELNI